MCTSKRVGFRLPGGAHPSRIVALCSFSSPRTFAILSSCQCPPPPRRIRRTPCRTPSPPCRCLRLLLCQSFRSQPLSAVHQGCVHQLSAYSIHFATYNAELTGLVHNCLLLCRRRRADLRPCRRLPSRAHRVRRRSTPQGLRRGVHVAAACVPRVDGRVRELYCAHAGQGCRVDCVVVGGRGCGGRDGKEEEETRPGKPEEV